MAVRSQNIVTTITEPCRLKGALRGHPVQAPSQSRDKLSRAQRLVQLSFCCLQWCRFHHLSGPLFQGLTAASSRIHNFYPKSEFPRFLNCCLLFLRRSIKKSWLHLLCILPVDSCRRQEDTPFSLLFWLKLSYFIVSSEVACFSPQSSWYPTAVLQYFGESKPNAVLQLQYHTCQREEQPLPDLLTTLLLLQLNTSTVVYQDSQVLFCKTALYPAIQLVPSLDGVHSYPARYQPLHLSLLKLTRFLAAHSSTCLASSE